MRLSPRKFHFAREIFFAQKPIFCTNQTILSIFEKKVFFDPKKLKLGWVVQWLHLLLHQGYSKSLLAESSEKTKNVWLV